MAQGFGKGCLRIRLKYFGDIGKGRCGLHIFFIECSHDLCTVALIRDCQLTFPIFLNLHTLLHPINLHL